jgi:hypothetical protein
MIGFLTSPGRLPFLLAAASLFLIAGFALLVANG